MATILCMASKVQHGIMHDSKYVEVMKTAFQKAQQLWKLHCAS